MSSLFSKWAAAHVILLWCCLFPKTVGLANRPDTTVKTWAREEAAVRMKREDDGEEVEFGVHYSATANKFNFETEEIGDVPQMGEEE